MDYLPLPDSAARQFIDSITIFEEYQRTRKQASQYAGGMYWKAQGPYEYLVKTQRDNSQERIGPRNEQTEWVYKELTSCKTAVEDRLKTLRAALTDAQRLNKALKVGRTPAMVIDILQALEDAGLAAHFTVVGAHSLRRMWICCGMPAAGCGSSPRWSVRTCRCFRCCNAQTPPSSARKVKTRLPSTPKALRWTSCAGWPRATIRTPSASLPTRMICGLCRPSALRY